MRTISLTYSESHLRRATFTESVPPTPSTTAPDGTFNRIITDWVLTIDYHDQVRRISSPRNIRGRGSFLYLCFCFLFFLYFNKISILENCQFRPWKKIPVFKHLDQLTNILNCCTILTYLNNYRLMCH